jgi:aldehyde:ferredoxin oxidoreductase
MVVSSSVTISPSTPVLLAAASGAHTHVIVKNAGSTALLVGGSASPAQWFAIVGNEKIDFVLELGEELWGNATTSNATAHVLVGNQ